MILLVDLGNTRLKWRLLARARLVKDGGVVHSGTHFEALLDRHWRELPAPRHIVVANVAGDTLEAGLETWCATHWRIQPHFIRPEVQAHGVTNGYLQPARLGADRWAMLIGARRHYKGALCIVGCGTAITVDALDTNGRHLGAVIMPGLTAMREALYQATAGIPDEGEAEFDLLARDTRSAVSAGAVYAACGGIDRLIDELEPEFEARMQYLLTGGDAERLRPLLRHPTCPAPDLVFQGLAVLSDVTYKEQQIL